MKSASTELFKQLPDKIFTPLASANRKRYWSVLCSLYKYKFGPEAPLPPTYGYLLSEIYKHIENHIKYEDWEDEGDDNSETPFNERAISIFNRLGDAGWMSVERHIMEKVVTMPPTVGEFLSRLISFAEKGPVFVSGKMRSIANLIEQIQTGSASGDGLREAAEQSRNLIQHIQNTSINIRNVIDTLNPKMPTSQYVRAFFQDYIEQYFIGDYRTLKTQDHPLAKRRHVVEAAESISENAEQRAALIAWYSQNLTKGDKEQAVTLLEKDLLKIFELNRIEEFLDRLDEELRRVNRKALAILNYKIKSIRPMENAIELAIKNLIHSKAENIQTPFASFQLMSGERLYEPKLANKKEKPEPLRKKFVSLRELAIARLMQKARESRSVSAPKLTSYIDQNLKNNESSQSHEQLGINTIEDLCAYQTLHAIAMAQASKSYDLKIESNMLARTFIVVQKGKNEVEHRYISGKPFLVKQKLKKRKLKIGE